MRQLVQVDAKDRQLMELLREDARTPIAALARELGVARTTVIGRLKRLERAGIIVGYTVRLDMRVQERLITVLVLITIDAKKGEAVMKALRAIPQIRSVYAISGVFDCVAFAEGQTTAEIDEVLDAIGMISGVSTTQSSLVLSVKFDRHRTA